MSELTRTKIDALWGTYLHGSPWYGKAKQQHRSAGGARIRMIHELQYSGHLQGHVLTSKGYAVLLALDPENAHLKGARQRAEEREAREDEAAAAGRAASELQYKEEVTEERANRRKVMAMCSFDVTTWTDEALEAFAHKLHWGLMP